MLLETLLANTKALRLSADAARRAGDTATQESVGARARLMTTVCSDIAKEGKDDGGRAATDKDALKVLRRFIGGIDESLRELSARAGAEAMGHVAELQAQRTLLQPYLDVFQPKTVPEADVEAAVRGILLGLPDQSPAGLEKALGTVMGLLKAKFCETLDGKVGSTVAKRVLAEAVAAAKAKAAETAAG